MVYSYYIPIPIQTFIATYDDIEPDDVIPCLDQWQRRIPFLAEILLRCASNSADESFNNRKFRCNPIGLRGRVVYAASNFFD